MRVSDLLADVIQLANDGTPIATKEVRLPSGRPAGFFHEAGAEERELARKLLGALADPQGTSAFDAMVGASAIPMVLYSTGDGRDHDRGLRGTDVACLAPVTRSGAETVLAILALARATPHPSGGAVGNRVALCERCGRFFLLPTLRPSRYCSRTCRERARVRRRRRGSDQAGRR